MSELSPALISIAGGNEFLFARFYHVYEGVQLVLPESPPIVSGVSDMPRRIVQTWKRHGIRCKHSVGRNAHIFLQRIFHLHFQRKSAYVLLIMLLITSTARKRGCTLNVQPLNKPILFSSGLKFFYVCLYLRLGKRIYK